VHATTTTGIINAAAACISSYPFKFGFFQFFFCA
jgi:hypothetical protein